MKPKCSICTDNFLSSDHISGTQCGHLFHHHCLERWFSSSGQQTCPRCRTKLPRKNVIHKIFIDENDDLDGSKDVAALQNKVAELDAKNSSHNKQRSDLLESLREAKDQVTLGQVQVTQLQDIIKKKEKDAKNERQNCMQLREALRQEKVKEDNQLVDRRARQRVEKELETLQDIKTILEGSELEVEATISKCGETPSSDSLRHLATCAAVLQKHNAELKQQKRQYKVRAEASETQSREQRKALLACKEELGHTKERLLNAEAESRDLGREVKKLKKRVRDLHAAIESPTGASASLVHRLLHESPRPSLASPALPQRPPETTKAGKTPQLSDPDASVLLFSSDEEDAAPKPKPSHKLSRVSSAAKENFATPEALKKGTPESVKRERCENLGIPFIKVRNFISNEPPKKKSKEAKDPLDPVLHMGIFSRLHSQSSNDYNGSSHIRRGYNGMGGHSLFTKPCEIPKVAKKTKKIVAKNPFAMAKSNQPPPPLPSLDDMMS